MRPACWCQGLRARGAPSAPLCVPLPPGEQVAGPEAALEGRSIPGWLLPGVAAVNPGLGARDRVKRGARPREEEEEGGSV